MMGQYLPQTNEKCHSTKIQNFLGTKQGLGWIKSFYMEK